jgi:hypothetical protein
MDFMVPERFEEITTNSLPRVKRHFGLAIIVLTSQLECPAGHRKVTL